LAVPPPSVYEVGGPSIMAAEGPSFPHSASRLPVPPAVIEDLSTRLGTGDSVSDSSCCRHIGAGFADSGVAKRHVNPATANYSLVDEQPGELTDAVFLRWVEAEMVSHEVESEKWRRLLLHWMYVAFDVSTDGREDDFFPRNGM
ncbi:hypothetical protein Tco_1274441, partial [Tanacetum coccineum]